MIRNKTIISLGIGGLFLFGGLVSNAEVGVDKLKDFYGIEKSKEVLNVKDLGVKGDNSTDDTINIQKAVDKASTEGKIVYFPKGNYKVTTNDSPVTKENATKMVNTDVGIKLKNNTHIMMEDDAYLRAIPNAFHSYTVLNVKDANNVKIQGGRIIGDKGEHLKTFPRERRGNPNYLGETGWGILMTGSSNVLVEGMTIKNLWGDGIDLFAKNPTDKSNKNITIRNNVIENNRRQGISIENGTDIVVENNLIQGTKGTDPSAGLLIETPDFSQHDLREARRIKIRNNRFLENNDAGVSLYGMGTRIYTDEKNGKKTGAMIEDIEITNNLMKGNNTNHQNTQEGHWKGAYNGQIMSVGASKVEIDDNVLLDPKPLGSMDNDNTEARFPANSNPTAGIYVGYSKTVKVNNNFMPKQDISVINQWSPPETFAYPNSTDIRLTNNRFNEFVKNEDINTKPEITKNENNVKETSTSKVSAEVKVIVKDTNGKIIATNSKGTKNVGDTVEVNPEKEVPTGYKVKGSKLPTTVVYTNNPHNIEVIALKDENSTKPSETVPSESKPEETKPSETVPSESKPEETKPSESKPSESKPEETKPSESKPSESKPEETNPSESKPSESKPEETNPSETQPSESKPEGTESSEPVTSESKPEGTESSETVTSESKPEGTESSETVTSESKPEETKQSETVTSESDASVENSNDKIGKKDITKLPKTGSKFNDKGIIQILLGIVTITVPILKRKN